MNDPHDLIPLDDPAEIASVDRRDAHDMIGWRRPDGVVEAYRWSAERFRERKRAAASVGTGQT